MQEPLAELRDPEELYKHYSSLATPRITYDIRKDIQRTDTMFRDYDDHDSPASKSLFNVLNAYSHYDREVGYVQGMNFIAAFILKHTRTKQKGEDGRC